MVPLLIFLGFLTVVIVIAIISGRIDSKRTETIRTVTAPQLGLDFVHTDETGIQSGFAGFNLFSQGRSPLIRNIAYGRIDDVEVMLFDYRYTTGSGKHKHTHHQTV